MRLFIAIELPDDVKVVLSRLRADITGARWVPVSQLHLTLSLLGDVDDASVKLLTSGLKQIRAPGFDLVFAGVGCFPNLRNPRVLWVGIRPEPFLNDLAAHVRSVVFACNIATEDRPFSPHITLARIRQPIRQPLSSFTDLDQKIELPAFPVREFILFASRLTPQGAIHTPLGSFPLI